MLLRIKLNEIEYNFDVTINHLKSTKTMEDFIGTIKLFGFNFAPRGWALCEGQLMSISQNTALFSLLGTTYGGDGRTTFGLPDLRSRVAVGQGRGPGLTDRKLGSHSGSETNVLNIQQLPAHGHAVNFDGQNITAGVTIPSVNDDGTLEESEGNILANKAGAYAASNAADASLAPFNAPISGSLQSGNTGNSQPINNMQPFVTINYAICLQGLFPSRS